VRTSRSSPSPISACALDAAGRAPKARFYADWRELRERAELDFIDISTPPSRISKSQLQPREGASRPFEKPLTATLQQAIVLHARAD